MEQGLGQRWRFQPALVVFAPDRESYAALTWGGQDLQRLAKKNSLAHFGWQKTELLKERARLRCLLVDGEQAGRLMC
jgi:hypothetical protein